MINTLNESSLHKSLKTLYCKKVNGQVEIKIKNWICDIVADKNIIEIQTGNLSSLKNKCADLLKDSYCVTIVAPLITCKTIVKQENEETKKRKSPKKDTIYSFLKNLTGIYPLLLEKNFSLEIPFVHISEERRILDYPVQSQNKRRRFTKNWLKVNKYLDLIEKTMIFNKKEHYLALLPKELKAQFSSADIKNAFLKEGIKITASNASLICWLFLRMGLIKLLEQKGRLKIYQLNQ